nr:nocturnin isoform X1 [Bactrocera oleae]
MQSHQDTFGAETTKRYGHRRTPTLGKAMPVTSLLLHFPPPSVSSMRNSCMRDGRTPDEERPPVFFQLEPSSYSSNTNDNHGTEKDNRHDDAHSSSDELNLENEYDLLVSECSSNGDDEASDNEHAISIVGNSVFYTPCMTCTDSAPGDMGARATAINEMCRRLCTDECRLRLSLAGLEPPSAAALKSQEALAEYVKDTCLQQRPQLQHTFSEDTVCASLMNEQKAGGVDEVDRVATAVGRPITLPTNLVTSATTADTPTNSMRPPSCIAIQRKKFLTDILTASSNDTDSDSSFADEQKEKAGDHSKKFIQFINNSSKPARDLADGTTTTKPDDDCYDGGRTHCQNDKATNAPVVDQYEMAMLKDFREKFAIAEALAKTSAMTSTVQMKQRLAARQLEITNANANAAKAATAANKDGCMSPTKKHRHRRRGEQHQKRQQQIQQKGVPPANFASTHNALTQSNNNNAIHSIDVNSRIDNNNDKDNNYHDASAERCSDCVKNVYSEGDECDQDDDDAENGSDCDCDCDYDSDNDDDFGFVDADNVATRKQQQQQENIVNDYEPPRDLLLYLVRMGSFNSAPKINNVDSQDDSLEIPKGLNTTELLKHVKHLRGIHQPQLLSRYFIKPSLTSDVTDGMRSLKLNTGAKDYNVASTLPNHIRVLQWNILSQTLGQNNDGFVRCPEEALTWENRKFLIVQEILQYNPDIICLQEVDHFKFLQTILGTQNYEGIFFPKPDSPCLYIEENNGPDGCAIFFRRDKFELKNFDTRILEVWRVQSNQVAIVVNLVVKSTGKEFCVCTTHLKARHGSLLAKLRNEQGRDLLHFVKQFCGEIPVLICGDFNAEPTEPVYATVLSGKQLQLASAYADIKVERDECNNDNANEHKAKPYSSDDGQTQSAEEEEVNAEHVQLCDDKVIKSIQCEPPYTTWKIREDGEECHTIDYVFYTPEQFKVRNCLEFPRDDEVGKNRTPSFQYPSDHFSLVCDFELLDKQ